MPSILYIINGNGLCSQMSGSFKRIVEVSHRLRNRGWEIHFLTTRGTQEMCQRIGLQVPLHLLPASIFKKRETNLFDRVWAYLLSTLASFWTIPRLPRFDLVFSDSDYFCDVIPACYYRRVKKTPWIGMIHHQMSLSVRDFKQLMIRIPSLALQKFSHYLMREKAAGLFVLQSGMGKDLAQKFIEKGCPEKKIFLVNNGVDLSYMRSLPEYTKEYEACFVGGIRLGKGIFDLVKIWEEVVKVLPGARLAIVGGGPRLEELRVTVERKQLQETVQVQGHVEKMEMIMKKSRFFLFPSYEEGWGIAICEAMACGLPTIAYDLPAYQGVFDNAILKAPIGDWEELAQMSIRLLQDSELYTKMRDKALKTVADFDWEKIALREENIFARIIRET